MADFLGLNYKTFLESLNYDEEKIQKYFNNLKESLEKEAILYRELKDKSISELYKDYEENLSLYDKVKEDILYKYFDEFKEINENYGINLMKIENEYIGNKGKILDIIDQEKFIINEIKRDELISFYEKKKDAQHRIREVNRLIDEEYEKHIGIILSAKEKLLSNNEFYVNAEKHINELDKSIKFLEEFSEFNQDFLSLNAKDTEDLNTNNLTIYLEFIDTEIEKIKSTSSVLSKYKRIEHTFTSILKELDTRIDTLSNDYKEIKRDIKDRLESIDFDIENINKYYDSSTLDHPEKKDLNDFARKEVISGINKKKERLIITSSFDIDLIEREKENIIKFKNALNNLNQELYKSYNDEITNNIGNLVSILESIKILIKDEINSISYFSIESRDSKDIIGYIKKRFNTLEIKKRSETYRIYRDYLIKLVDDNKELDSLAFEILTSEELLKIKLLDLKRELQTINDKTEISIIEYDSSIKEIEDTWPQTHVILDKKAELDLINHDYEIDKSILKHELDNQIYLLDFRKEIDLLRLEYMIAYSRLENITKVIDKVNTDDPKIKDIESQIMLERIIELTLLEFSGKKKEYDSSHSSSTKGLEALESETNSRIRYLNNVLEIERNNFEERKRKLVETTKKLKEAYYPALIENKRKAGDELKALKKETLKNKKEIIETNEKEIQLFNDLNKDLESLYEEYQNKLHALVDSAFESLDSYINNIDVFIKNTLNTFRDFENEVNSKINSLAYKNIKKYEYNKKSVLDSIDKLNNLLIESSFDKLEKYKKNSLSIIDKEISESINSINKLLNEVRPYTDKELDEILKSIDSKYKEKIAEIAINNTILQTPTLEKIYDVEKDQDKIREGYEIDIAAFKKQYLETMDTIKREYQERFDELTGMKDAAIRYNEDMNDSISRKILEAYENIKENLNEDIESIKKTSTEQKEKANSMVEILSDDILEKNKAFENSSKNIIEDNKNYRKELSKKAIEYYQKIENIKDNNEKELERLKYEKLSYREKYVSDLIKNASLFKESYVEYRSNIINESEERVLDKTLEFTKLFNKIKDDSYNSFENIEKPIHKFIDTSESLTDNIITKTSETTKDLTESAIKSLDEFTKELDKNLNNF